MTDIIIISFPISYYIRIYAFLQFSFESLEIKILSFVPFSFHNSSFSILVNDNTLTSPLFCSPELA